MEGSHHHSHRGPHKVAQLHPSYVAGVFWSWLWVCIPYGAYFIVVLVNFIISMMHTGIYENTQCGHCQQCIGYWYVFAWSMSPYQQVPPLTQASIHTHAHTHTTPHPCTHSFLGCGVGMSTRALADAFPQASTTGLDLSAYFLAVAEHTSQYVAVVGVRCCGGGNGCVKRATCSVAEDYLLKINYTA